jgi:hypothetical protein
MSNLEEAAATACREVRQTVIRLAAANGAEIREKPLWPGAHSVVRYAEPLAGIRAGVVVSNAASREVRDYITRAREDGAGWLEIGRAFGLEAEDIAVAAYERAAGEGSLGRPGAYGFTCGACEQAVRDDGPYAGHPLDCEEGHADDCARMTEAVRAWQRAQWGDGDE